MNDLKTIVNEKEYRQFKGADWPHYNDFISGSYFVSDQIKQELNDFIGIMEQQYQDITSTRTVELSVSNQKRQKHIFFDKKYIGGQVCTIPWKTLGINSNGNIFICESPSWIPIFIGNILETDNIFDILNNDKAKKIRQEILANRYFYCNSDICGFFQHQDTSSYTSNYNENDTVALPLKDDDTLQIKDIPSQLIFDFDYSCNFKCPSCRTEYQNYNRHHIIRPLNEKISTKIKNLIIDKIKDQPTTIRWCGGEPFMSDVYIDLFEYIIQTKNKNIKNIIQTNGSLLITKQKLVEKLLPYTKDLRISFDAGTEETYQLTRVGGNWQNLIDNVKFVKKLIQENNLTTNIYADFVVQKNNYRDLPAFATLCKELGMQVNIQKMWNWGTWDSDTFDDMNVYNKNHPLYQDLVTQFEVSHLTMAKN